MKLLTTSLREKLLANGRANRDADGLPREHGYIDHKPVVKLFTPDGAATWLLTEIDPDDPDRAFGLCDLGFGCPELGYVSLDRKSTRLNSSHPSISYAVFCLKKKKKK